MFSNAQQSIPKRFIDKMEIDAKIQELLKKKSEVLRSVYTIVDDFIYLRPFHSFQDVMKEIDSELEPMLEEQAALRKSCEAFILDQKTRGPMATA